MSSLADDSSVDDNTSSIGEAAWDIIDDESAVSDEDALNLSRVPTPSIDGNYHSTEEMEASAMENKDLTPPESRNKLTTKGPRGAQHRRPESLVVAQDNPGGQTDMLDEIEEPDSIEIVQEIHWPHGVIKFEEEQTKDHKAYQDVSLPLVSIKGQRALDFLEPNKATHLEQIYGAVRMRMSNHELQLDGPFRLLYVGPREMRAPIVEKIGSALATTLSSSATQDELDLSRVTIVPISSFGDFSSPDVTLVPSMGLDMRIEECTDASFVKEAASRGTIGIQLNSSKMVRSAWNPNRKDYEIVDRYDLPDLAIVYLSEDETAPTKQVRTLARSFLHRHHVPVLHISFEPAWRKTKQIASLDYRMPHLSLQKYPYLPSELAVFSRLPVDLSTFLALDAGQLKRSLACLSSHTKVRTEPCNRSSKYNEALQSSYTGYKGLLRHGVILILWTLCFGIAFTRMRGFVSVSNTTSTSNMSCVPATSSALAPLPPAVPAPSPAKASPTPMSSLALHYLDGTGLVTRPKRMDLASLLFDTQLAPNKSDSFQIHVVGDCHVILQPPQWYTSMKKAPALSFKVHRQGKTLTHEVSALFDKVYVLKFLREDAYGMMNISVSTTKKPRINEEFQVDLGTPWLKIAGWQKAAQAVSDQVRGDFQIVHTGLSKAYSETSKGLQALAYGAMGTADLVLKEAEKVGLKSLHRTANTTAIMLAQSKDVSRSFSRELQRHGAKVFWKFAAHRQNLRKDLGLCTLKVSSVLSNQARSLAEAATGVNVVTLKKEIQEYRKIHLRDAQKKALRLWWKLTGPPPLTRAPRSPSKDKSKCASVADCKGGKGRR